MTRLITAALLALALVLAGCSITVTAEPAGTDPAPVESAPPVTLSCEAVDTPANCESERARQACLQEYEAAAAARVPVGDLTGDYETAMRPYYEAVDRLRECYRAAGFGGGPAP